LAFHLNISLDLVVILKFHAGVTGAASCLNLFLGRQMIGLFLDRYDREIIEYGYQYLVIIAVFFVLLCTLQIIRSSLQGMGTAGYIGIYLTTPLAWGLTLALLLTRYFWIMRKD